MPERAAEAEDAFGADAVMDDDPPAEGTVMSGTGYEPPESVVPVALVPPFANVYPSARSTVTATPAAAAPLSEALTVAPVIVEHSTPE